MVGDVSAKDTVFSSYQLNFVPRFALVLVFQLFFTQHTHKKKFERLVKTGKHVQKAIRSSVSLGKGVDL